MALLAFCPLTAVIIYFADKANRRSTAPFSDDTRAPYCDAPPPHGMTVCGGVDIPRPHEHAQCRRDVLLLRETLEKAVDHARRDCVPDLDEIVEWQRLLDGTRPAKSWSFVRTVCSLPLQKGERAAVHLEKESLGVNTMIVLATGDEERIDVTVWRRGA